MTNTIEVTKESPMAQYQRGTDCEQEIHKEAERNRKPTLRGGSVGCLLDDGTAMGCSPLKALARYLGYQFAIPNKTFKIFDGGFANEHTWESKFKVAGTQFRCEEDYPLTYNIGEYVVTGRPDIVVGDYHPEFIPTYGIELKSVASVGTAKKVFEDFKPKDDNFIQACHYMWKFGIPWVLVYSSTSIQKDYEFAKWFYDKSGKRVMSIHNECGDKRQLFELNKDVAPQDIEFKIGLDDGTFYYLHPETGERVNTLVTTQGIENYYKLVIEMIETKDISKGKLSQIDMFGKKIFYDTNAYDEMQLMSDPKACGYDLDVWAAQIKRMTQQPYMLQIRKKKYQVIKDGEFIIEYDTRREALDYIDDPKKFWGVTKL